MLFLGLNVQSFRVLWLLILLASLLTGCQQPPLRHLDTLYDPTVSVAEYLARSQRSSAINANTWRLLAIRAALQKGQVAEAIKQLEALTTPLTDEQQSEQQLLTLALAIEERDLSTALGYSNALSLDNLSQTQKIRYYQLRYALAHWQQDRIETLVALISLQPLLASTAQAANQQQIWLRLTVLSPAERQAFCQRNNSPTGEGWLALLTLYETHYQSQQQRQQAIETWCQQYPNHPAIKQLPIAISQQLNSQPLQLKKIGLLLPLHGAFAPYGQSLYQGFMEAMQQSTGQRESLQKIEVDAEQQITPYTQVPEIVIYDTTVQPLKTLLAQAQQEEISVLVGPLRKQDVEQLGQLKINIPLLALNIPRQSPNPQRAIYYYGLTQNDEAQEAARRLWRQKKQHPLILVPQNETGEKAAEVFQHTWQQLAGYQPVIRYFPSSAELKQLINRLSRQRQTKHADEDALSEDADLVEESSLLSLFPLKIDESVGSTSWEPQAIDAVYLVAIPEEFILLKSLLDMACSSSADRPSLYASSRCLQSTMGPDLRLEMEGLQFVDIPLLITQQPSFIYQQASKQCHGDFSLMRLYAMGYDTWSLINHFEELIKLPYFQLSGLTGILKADSCGIIRRQLVWACYHHGQRAVQP